MAKPVQPKQRVAPVSSFNSWKHARQAKSSLPLTASGRERRRSRFLVTLLVLHAATIAELALKSRLITVGLNRAWARAGVLLTYGPSFFDLHKRAAAYVDKILKGAVPANLPVEQPTTFELLVNLKTAKALGLTVPATLLGRAERGDRIATVQSRIVMVHHHS